MDALIDLRGNVCILIFQIWRHADLHCTSSIFTTDWHQIGNLYYRENICFPVSNVVLVLTATLIRAGWEFYEKHILLGSTNPFGKLLKQRLELRTVSSAKLIFSHQYTFMGTALTSVLLAALPWPCSLSALLKQKLLSIPSFFGKALFVFHGTNKSIAQIFYSSGNPCFLDSFHTVHNPFQLS